MSKQCRDNSRSYFRWKFRRVFLYYDTEKGGLRRYDGKSIDEPNGTVYIGALEFKLPYKPNDAIIRTRFTTKIPGRTIINIHVTTESNDLIYRAKVILHKCNVQVMPQLSSLAQQIYRRMTGKYAEKGIFRILKSIIEKGNVDGNEKKYNEEDDDEEEEEDDDDPPPPPSRKQKDRTFKNYKNNDSIKRSLNPKLTCDKKDFERKSSEISGIWMDFVNRSKLNNLNISDVWVLFSANYNFANGRDKEYFYKYYVYLFNIFRYDHSAIFYAECFWNALFRQVCCCLGICEPDYINYLWGLFISSRNTIGRDFMATFQNFILSSH